MQQRCNAMSVVDILVFFLVFLFSLSFFGFFYHTFLFCGSSCIYTSVTCLVPLRSAVHPTVDECRHEAGMLPEETDDLRRSKRRRSSVSSGSIRRARQPQQLQQLVQRLISRH